MQVVQVTFTTNSSFTNCECSHSTGIGAAVAKGLARSGCTKIAITDINPDTLNQTKKSILAINPDAQVFNHAGDISDEKFVDSFHEEVFSKFSRLDYAVNCAGVLGDRTVKAVEMPTKSFDRLNDINYRGTWLSCRAQLRNMLRPKTLSAEAKERGSIVNIASQLGIVGRPGAGKQTCTLPDPKLTLFRQRLIAHPKLR